MFSRTFALMNGSVVSRSDHVQAGNGVIYVSDGGWGLPPHEMVPARCDLMQQAINFGHSLQFVCMFVM